MENRGRLSPLPERRIRDVHHRCVEPQRFLNDPAREFELGWFYFRPSQVTSAIVPEACP